MDWQEKLKAIEHVSILGKCPRRYDFLKTLNFIFEAATGYYMPAECLFLECNTWEKFVETVAEWRKSVMNSSHPIEFHLNEIAHFLVHGTDFDDVPEMADLRFAAAVEICREAFGWKK